MAKGQYGRARRRPQYGMTIGPAALRARDAAAIAAGRINALRAAARIVGTAGVRTVAQRAAVRWLRENGGPISLAAFRALITEGDRDELDLANDWLRAAPRAPQ